MDKPERLNLGAHNTDAPLIAPTEHTKNLTVLVCHRHESLAPDGVCPFTSKYCDIGPVPKDHAEHYR